MHSHYRVNSLQHTDNNTKLSDTMSFKLSSDNLYYAFARQQCGKLLLWPEGSHTMRLIFLQTIRRWTLERTNVAQLQLCRKSVASY